MASIEVKTQHLPGQTKDSNKKTPVRIKVECRTRFELGTSKCKLKVLLLEPPCSLTQFRLKKEEHIKNFDVNTCSKAPTWKADERVE